MIADVSDPAGSAGSRLVHDDPGLEPVAVSVRLLPPDELVESEQTGDRVESAEGSQ